MGLISSWIILLFVALVLLFVSVTAQNTEQLGDSFDVNPLDTNAAIEASVKRQIGYSFVKAWIENQLPIFIKDISIPDYEKKTFWYSYGFTGANVTDFTTPSISIIPSGNDVIAQATDGHISAKGNYQLRLTFFKTSGTVTVTVKDVSITLRGNYDNQVRIKSCSGSIGSLQVTLSGKLLNLFRKHLEQPFRHAIQSKLCSWTKNFS